MMTQLISYVHYTGEWPRDVTELSMIALEKKPRATKYNDHSTISRQQRGYLEEELNGNSRTCLEIGLDKEKEKDLQM